MDFESLTNKIYRFEAWIEVFETALTISFVGFLSLGILNKLIPLSEILFILFWLLCGVYVVSAFVLARIAARLKRLYRVLMEEHGIILFTDDEI